MSEPGEAFPAKGRGALARKPPTHSQDSREEAVAFREGCFYRGASDEIRPRRVGVEAIGPFG